ncbi:MAG: hypothetical protein ACRCYO_02300 [Bacteroidia bacterium]
MKTIFSILVAVILLNTSCSTLRIEKRRYGRGWHIERVVQNRTATPSLVHTNQNSSEARVATNEDQDEMCPIAAKEEKCTEEKIGNTDISQSIVNNDSLKQSDQVLKHKKAIGLGVEKRINKIQKHVHVKEREGLGLPRLWKAALLLSLILTVATVVSFFLPWALTILFAAGALTCLLVALFAYLFRAKKSKMKIDPESGEAIPGEKGSLWLGYFFASLGITLALMFVEFLVVLFWSILNDDFS